MKTSNIILLGIFASILIWILVVFFTAKAKIKEIINQEEDIEIIHLDKKDNIIELSDFKNISIKGDGFIEVTQGKKNSLTVKYDEDAKTEIKGQTLYIDFDGNYCTLTIKELNKVKISENIKAEIKNLKTDTLNIYSKEDIEVDVKNIRAKFIKLKSEDNSIVHFYNINNKVPEAEFDIKDDSEVTINNTKGMSISVKKGADAKYKDY